MSKKIYTKIFIFAILFSLFTIILSTDEQNETKPKFTDPYKDQDFGNVKKLDDSTFIEEFKKNETMYILFYAPIGELSKEFIPLFIDTANYAKEKNLDIKFTAMNALANTKTSHGFPIKTFPALFLIYKSQTIPYDGPKDKNHLIKFVERKKIGDIYKFNTLKEVEDFTSKSSLVLLSTLKYKSMAIYQSFEKYSHEICIVDFISCLSDECIKKYGEDLTLFKSFDEKINVFSKDYGGMKNGEIDSVKKFIGTYAVEAGGLLNIIDVNMIFDYEKKAIFYFRNSTNVNHTQYDKLFKELGLELRKQNTYSFILDIMGDKFQEEISNTFTVTMSQIPCFLYFDPSLKNENYHSIRKANKNHLTKEFIKQYIEDIQHNKTSKYDNLKTEVRTGVKDFFNFVNFGYVMKLNDSNYAEQLNKNETMYIMFYDTDSKTSERSLNLLTDFIEAANYSEINNLNIKFAAIDSGKNPNVTNLFKIENLPSFYLMYKDKQIYYGGKLDKDHWVKYVERQKNDDLFTINSVKEIDEYKSLTTLVLLSTIKDKSSPIYKSFTNYSHFSMNVEFLSCESNECLKEYGEDMILFKPFDEKINKYSKDFGDIKKAEIDSIKKFVGMFGIETGAVLNATDMTMMMEHNKKILLYFRNASLPEQTKYDQLFKELGKELRKDNIYTFILQIEKSKLHEDISKTFTVLSSELPCYLFYDVIEGDPEGSTKYYSKRKATENQLTKEYIKQFIKDARDNKIKKDLFSAAPREITVLGTFKHVIGKTYDRDVIEEKKNVAIALLDSSGYCNNCDQVFKMFKELSDKYGTDKEKNIQFAFMDVHYNEPRDLTLSPNGAPFIFLYTNAMPEKKTIQFMPKNVTNFDSEEVEEFLAEKLKWKNWKKAETKEKKDENKSDL